MAAFRYERDLEDFICKHPRCLRDMNEARVIARQVNLPHGRLDLLMLSNFMGRDPMSVGTLEVIELKNGPLTLNAIVQVLRYCNDVREIIQNVAFHDLDFCCVNDWITRSQGVMFSVTDEYITPMLVGTSIGQDELAACNEAKIAVKLYYIDSDNYVRIESAMCHDDNHAGTNKRPEAWVRHALTALRGVAAAKVTHEMYAPIMDGRFGTDAVAKHQN